MSQYFDVSGVNLVSSGGSRLYENTVAINLSESAAEIISEGINSKIYSFPINTSKTTLEIGKDASGKYINGCIKSFTYYSQSLTSQQLKSLTSRKETTPLPSASEPNLTMGVSIISQNTTWNLRSTGTVNYDVDWGDGQIETEQTSNTKAHTYASPGIYKVVVKIRSGVWRPFYNNNVDAERIVSIFGTGTGWSFGTNLANAFQGGINITFIDNLTGTSLVTDFSNFCIGCNSLIFFPFLNTSSGTNFTNTWHSCISLTSFPLLDTSKGTNFTGTWQNCISLKSFPLINTSSATNFNRTWFNCRSLSSFPIIDCSKVTNFVQAWFGCSSLSSFPLLNTSSGTSFEAAWNGCTSLTNFPLLNASNVTNFGGAWINCSSLTSFPVLDTSKGTIFGSAWYGCSSLTSFPQINTSLGTDFIRAWFSCFSLTSFPVIDTSKGTNFLETWRSCGITSFPELNFSSAVGLASQTNTGFSSTWRFCNLLTTFPANRFDNVVATNFSNAFEGCALTAQSIENILVSINIASTSNGSLSFSGGTNATKTTWTTAANAAYDALISRGWTITFRA
jgi:hypothetical protein